jgi:hypothetical protein
MSCSASAPGARGQVDFPFAGSRVDRSVGRAHHEGVGGLTGDARTGCLRLSSARQVN